MPAGNPNLKAELMTRWWNNHPRYRWMCALPPRARVLDCGAGIGYLPAWMNMAQRQDIVPTAHDKVPQAWQGYYDLCIADLEDENCLYALNGASYDAVLMSHVIEHLADPHFALSEMHRLLKNGGSLYIETPTEATLAQPPLLEYRAMHLPVIGACFWDDLSHHHCYSRDNLIALLEREEFKVKAWGVVRNQFVEDALREYGKYQEDAEAATAGIASCNELSQYIIVEKVFHAD